MWELRISYRGEHTPGGLLRTSGPLLKIDWLNFSTPGWCKRNARMVETSLEVLFWILPQVSDAGCDPLIWPWAALNYGP